MQPEPWLDKRGLADHFACSVRSIETALAAGLPHAVIFGRPKFKVSIVEPWLEQHGYIERGDGIPATVDAATQSGAAPRERPAPDTEEISNGAQQA
jgi:hypothetical protein